MPGGWTLSMIWMPMHGGTWSGAAAAFVVMWTGMMVPMMLPSVAPTLAEYRRRLAERGEAYPATRCALAAAAYLATWMALGTLLFPLGAFAAAWMMRAPATARAVPALTALVVIAGGAIQFTSWKARRLSSCDRTLARAATLPAGMRRVVAAWPAAGDRLLRELRQLDGDPAGRRGDGAGGNARGYRRHLRRTTLATRFADSAADRIGGDRRGCGPARALTLRAVTRPVGRTSLAARQAR